VFKAVLEACMDKKLLEGIGKLSISSATDAQQSLQYAIVNEGLVRSGAQSSHGTQTQIVLCDGPK
jgi:hypothetical protein